MTDFNINSSLSVNHYSVIRLLHFIVLRFQVQFRVCPMWFVTNITQRQNKANYSPSSAVPQQTREVMNVFTFIRCTNMDTSLRTAMILGIYIGLRE